MKLFWKAFMCTPEELPMLMSLATCPEQFSPPPSLRPPRPVFGPTSPFELLSRPMSPDTTLMLRRRYWRHHSMTPREVCHIYPDGLIAADTFLVVMEQFHWWSQHDVFVTEELLTDFYALTVLPSTHPVHHEMLYTNPGNPLPGYVFYVSFPSRPVISGANLDDRDLAFASMWVQAMEFLDEDSPLRVSVEDIMRAVLPGERPPSCRNSDSDISIFINTPDHSDGSSRDPMLSPHESVGSTPAGDEPTEGIRDALASDPALAPQAEYRPLSAADLNETDPVFEEARLDYDEDNELGDLIASAQDLRDDEFLSEPSQPETHTTGTDTPAEAGSGRSSVDALALLEATLPTATVMHHVDPTGTAPILHRAVPASPEHEPYVGASFQDELDMDSMEVVDEEEDEGEEDQGPAVPQGTAPTDSEPAEDRRVVESNCGVSQFSALPCAMGPPPRFHPLRTSGTT